MTFKIRDVIITYFFICVAFILLSKPIYGVFGIPGIAITQIITMFIPVILLTLIFKKDFRKVFILYKPKDTLLMMLAAIGLWVLVLFISGLFAVFALRFLPPEPELFETYNFLFENITLIQQILLIGLMPAIIEESVFRGFVFSAFLERKKPILGIIISSIMFAALHLSLIKFVPTFLLGVLFSYIVYKTNSIIPAMIMHFVNNSFSVITQFFLKDIEIPELFIIQPINLNSLIIISIILLLLKIVVSFYKRNHQLYLHQL